MVFSHPRVFAALCALFIIGACSSSNETTTTSVSAVSSGSGNAGGSGGSTAMGGASVNVGVGGTSAVTIGSGGSCPSSCGSDLKTVIDCNGNVTETCGLDKACLNGTCSDKPCEAASEAKSSIGCDYWAMKPDFIPNVGGEGACFAAYIANTWDTAVKIEASRDGSPLSNFIYIPAGQGSNLTYEPYDPAIGLPVGKVAILFLAEQKPKMGALPVCPKAAGYSGNPGIAGTGFGKAINITTDKPVVAYTVFPFGGGSAAATSASLLLPTPVWDTNYIAVNAYKKSQAAAPAFPSMSVLAQEDNTTVTVLPKVDIVGGNMNGMVGMTPANTQATFTLNKGEYVQLSQEQELSGSPIQADKPVAVWGAASCLSVPVGALACDSAHQQIPPVNALGHEYVGVRYLQRKTVSAPKHLPEEKPPWRLIGAVDGTVLTWTPSPPTGAPTTLNQGEVAEFEASGPFVVKSQDKDHPFYMGQYMTGFSEVDSQSEGDPEWVNVIPPQQYLNRYVFFTDPTYSETNLVVVRAKDPKTQDFADVTLGCAGVLSDWKSIGDYQYTRPELVNGNFMNVGNCSNGQHEISSSAPFGVTVWGWGKQGTTPSTQAVSYAYPAGAGIKPINEITVPTTPK